MTRSQRLRHLATWPLRMFFDRRFGELESGITEIEASQRALAELIDQRVSTLLAPLQAASEELRQQAIATSETLTYIGVELRRLTDAVEEATRNAAMEQGATDDDDR